MNSNFSKLVSRDHYFNLKPMINHWYRMTIFTNNCENINKVQTSTTIISPPGSYLKMLGDGQVLVNKYKSCEYKYLYFTVHDN